MYVFHNKKMLKRLCTCTHRRTNMCIYACHVVHMSGLISNTRFKFTFMKEAYKEA